MYEYNCDIPVFKKKKKRIGDINYALYVNFKRDENNISTN